MRKIIILDEPVEKSLINIFHSALQKEGFSIIGAIDTIRNNIREEPISQSKEGK